MRPTVAYPSEDLFSSVVYVSDPLYENWIRVLTTGIQTSHTDNGVVSIERLGADPTGSPCNFVFCAGNHGFLINSKECCYMEKVMLALNNRDAERPHIN